MKRRKKIWILFVEEIEMPLGALQGIVNGLAGAVQVLGNRFILHALRPRNQDVILVGRKVVLQEVPAMLVVIEDQKAVLVVFSLRISQNVFECHLFIRGKKELVD